MRGIGLDDFNTNNSSGVGTYLDEVFASFPGFLTGAMYDVDRVEILKGPQGTLYGKNTAGGAINIISRQPTDDVEGYVDVDYQPLGDGRRHGADQRSADEYHQGALGGNHDDAGRGISDGHRYGRRSTASSIVAAPARCSISA